MSFISHLLGIKHVCGNSWDTMDSSIDAVEASVDAMEARLGEDAAKVGVGSNGPHHMLASVEGVEHGVSHGGGCVVGHSGGDVVAVGHQGRWPTIGGGDVVGHAA